MIYIDIYIMKRTVVALLLVAIVACLFVIPFEEVTAGHGHVLLVMASRSSAFYYGVGACPSSTALKLVRCRVVEYIVDLSLRVREKGSERSRGCNRR